MIKNLIYKLYIDHYITPRISRHLCFKNNLRARGICILFLFIALISTIYDFLIYKNTVDFKLFIAHFKADIIFMILTIIFLLYVFYNQVKKSNEIKRQHQFIHGAISLLIISWGAVKSSLTLLTDDINYYIYFITVLITAVTFYFPFIIYLSQIIFSYLLLWLIHLLLDITLKTFFFNLSFIFILLLIAFFISRVLYYYKVKHLMKEEEITKLKKHINQNGT